MTTPGSSYYGGQPPAPPRRRGLSRRWVLVLAAAIILSAAAIAVIAVVLPKAWQTATGPSRQAGREYAAHWLQSPTAIDASTAFNIDLRCVYGADQAAKQGTDLANGRHLTPGMIMRAEFRNACIDEVTQHVGQHQ